VALGGRGGELARECRRRRRGRRRGRPRGRRGAGEMGERKVLNKYYDPDFDPSAKLPRVKGPGRDAAQQSRLMLPFSLKCCTCGHYMRLGKKFNATKETAIGMDYLTIKRFRFRFKCEACRAPISFLTDPKNADYECESGATRNYDFRKEQQQEAAAAAAAKAELTDGMSKLEARTLDSKREMEALDELDELQQQNDARAALERRAAAGAAALLAAEASAERGDALPDVDQEEEDRLVAAAFALKRSRVQRLDDEQDEDKDAHEIEDAGAVAKTCASSRDKADDSRATVPSAKPADDLALLPIVTRIVKRKKVVAEDDSPAPLAAAAAAAAPALAPAPLGGLFAAYGSDSDDE
jgi:hypothetical protein